MRRLEALSRELAFSDYRRVVVLWLSWMRPMMLPDEGRFRRRRVGNVENRRARRALLNGMPFFHSRRCTSWPASAAFDVFGVHAWTARLPSWLAAWLAAMAVCGFLRRYRRGPDGDGGLAGIGRSRFFFGAAQFANLDMLVAGMITLTTVAGASTVLNATRGGRWRWLAVATAVLAALGVLSKGPDRRRCCRAAFC